MSGFNWPIAIYDFLGILVPGLGLGAVLSFALPSLPRLYVAYPVPMLLLAFVAGHVVQGLSKCAYHLLGHVWPEKTFWEASDETLKLEVLGRLAIAYGPGLQCEVLIPSEDTKDEKRRNLCYSLVWDRMDNERLFTALADFSRASGLLALLFAGLSVYLWGAGPWTLPQGLTGLSLGLILFALFTTRSRFFRKHADSTVYYGFLAYAAVMAGPVAPRPANLSGPGA